MVEYSSQESEEYIAKGKKKARQRQENSLGELTNSFIRYVNESGTDTININELVKKLKVKKRRIYDITNVLEGIGYIKKHAKNEISWIRYEQSNEDNSNSSINQHQKYTQQVNKGGNHKTIIITNLEKENKRLDQSINKIKEQFTQISNRDEFTQYGYVTFEDLKLLTSSEKINLIAIKAPKGTSLDIIDPKETKKAYIKTKAEMENGTMNMDDALLDSLKKEHHLFLEAPKEEIQVYVALTESESKNNNNINNIVLSNNCNNNMSNGNELNKYGIDLTNHYPYDSNQTNEEVNEPSSDNEMN